MLRLKDKVLLYLPTKSMRFWGNAGFLEKVWRLLNKKEKRWMMN